MKQLLIKHRRGITPSIGFDDYFIKEVHESYSQIGQEEGRTAFNLLGAGFAGSGWESQSIYSLYNVSAVSTTYVLAYAQNNSIPIYSINSTNVDELVPLLQLPSWASWIRDYIRSVVASGYVVVIPERDVTINQWHGVGFAVIEPTTGLGAYIITGYLAGNATAASVAYGGMATQAMNMSSNAPYFGGNSGNLSEGLRNASVEKEEAKNRVIMNLFFPLVVPGSYLFLYAVISRYGIATLGAGVVAGALSVSMLMAPLIIYTGFVLYPDVKIWWDPYGEVYVAEARS